MTGRETRPKAIRNPVLAREVANAVYSKLFNHKGPCLECVKTRKDRRPKPLSGHGKCLYHETMDGFRA